MSINIRKTRMAVVSDLLAILTFIVLTLVFKAQPHDFNTVFFMEEVHRIHLTNEDVKTEYECITNIRTEINAYIRHESVFDRYLDEICENIVGNTMMKLLLANMRVKSSPPLKIEIGPEDQFVPDEDIIYINPGFYDHITGITTISLCGIDRSGALVEKYDTIGEGLFHELCHAFHIKSGICTMRNIKEKVTISSIYRSDVGIKLWDCDEEVLNMCGKTLSGFDPICCNMYDICKYYSAPEFIIQRVFHIDWASLPELELEFDQFDPLDRIEWFLIDISEYILTKI